jgi:hypothetical protein
MARNKAALGFIQAFNRSGGTDAFVDFLNQQREKARIEAYSKGLEDARQNVVGASQPRVNSVPMNYNEDQGLGMSGRSMSQQPMYQPDIIPSYETAANKAKNSIGEWFTQNLNIAPERGKEGYAFLQEFMPQAPAKPSYETIGEGQSLLQLQPDGTVQEVYKNAKPQKPEETTWKNVTPNYRRGTYYGQKPNGEWADTGIGIKPEDWGKDGDGSGSGGGKGNLDFTKEARDVEYNKQVMTTLQNTPDDPAYKEAQARLSAIGNGIKATINAAYPPESKKYEDTYGYWIDNLWTELSKQGIDTTDELNIFLNSPEYQQLTRNLDPTQVDGTKQYLQAKIYTLPPKAPQPKKQQPAPRFIYPIQSIEGR